MAGKVGFDGPSSGAETSTLNRVVLPDSRPEDFKYNGEGQSAWNTRMLTAMNQQGPQGNWQNSNGSRLDQQQALQQMGQTRGLMYDAAMGRGPSAAGAQFQQGLDQSIAAQMAAANSARGGGIAQASAQRAAMQGADAMRAQAAGQAAMLRAQEMNAARAGLLNADQNFGSAAQGLRGMDQAQTLGQLNADITARGQNNQLAGLFGGFGMHAADAEQQGRQALATLDKNASLQGQVANLNYDLGQATNATNLTTGTISAGAGALGGLLGFLGGLSDKAAKERVKDGADEVDEMMAKLRPVSYQYKEAAVSLPGASEGRQTGIMAQDLASSKAGSRMVARGEDGYLRVDIGKAALAGLAAAARLSERLDKLERGKR